MTDRKWAPVSLLLIVLVIPPVVRYLDGRTMVDCARSLMGREAMSAAQVCPTDGSADWLMHVGIDVNQLSGGNVKTESLEGEAAADQELQTKANYVFHRLVEDWWPPKEDKAGDNTTELRAALRDHYEPSLKELVREAQGSDLWRWYRTTYRSVFSFLREYLPIAHNYPIVTVTFESSPAIFRTDAATGGLQTLCLPAVKDGQDQSDSAKDDQDQSISLPKKNQDRSKTVKVSGPAADWTLAKFVASLSNNDACQLVDGTTSTRMLYLGEAGAWTLLYSLGPDGAPIFFKTKDLSSISYKPVTIRRTSVPEQSLPGVTVNVGPIEVPVGPIDVQVDPMEMTLEVEQKLVDAAALMIGKATGEIVTAVKAVEERVAEVSGRIEEVSGGIEEVSGGIEEVSGGIEEVSGRIEEVSGGIEEVSGRIERVRVALIGPGSESQYDDPSIGALLLDSSIKLEDLRKELNIQVGLLSSQLTDDLRDPIEKRLIEIDGELERVKGAIVGIESPALEDIRDELAGLRMQIGGPHSKPVAPDAKSDGGDGMVGGSAEKFEDMPRDVTERGDSPSASEAATRAEDTGEAGDVYRLVAGVNSGLLGVNKSLMKIAKILDERLGRPADANMELPAIFIGIEKRIEKVCLKQPVVGSFAFDRFERDIPLPEIKEGVNDLFERIKKWVAELDNHEKTTKESKLLLVMIEGTADTIDSPPKNREISEARASFIQKQLEAKLEANGIDPGKNDIKRVVMAAYGTGEWSHREKTATDGGGTGAEVGEPRFYRPRSALVRLCELPPSVKRDPGEVAQPEGAAVQQDDLAAAE